MRYKKILSYFCLFYFFFISNANSQIEDKIIAKIGNEIITNFDVINEINTLIAISNESRDKDNFKRYQNVAFVSIKKRIIKEIEIKKYKVENYNNEDLQNYVNGLKISLKLKDKSLEEHFNNYNANYELFIKSAIVNLKWNTLIYSLYRKQLNVDQEIVKSQITEAINKEKEVEEYNLSEIVVENLNQDEMNKILNSINQKGFEETATLYSSSITSSKGGLIGWISKKSISESYLREISKLEVGGISQPISNNTSVIFIKLNEKRQRLRNKNNLNLEIIEKNVINNKKEEMLNIFSNSHYLNLEKQTFMEINE